MEKLWLFWLFSGDKGDNTDMWMIKITIKANQIDTDVLLISKVDNIQKPCLSLKSGFFHYFIGLWILPSRTNMVPKIYGDLYALGTYTTLPGFSCVESSSAACFDSLNGRSISYLIVLCEYTYDGIMFCLAISWNRPRRIIQCFLVLKMQCTKMDDRGMIMF